MKGSPRFIKAGWLVNGTGGPSLRDVLLDIEDGRIAAIRDAVDDQPPFRSTADFADCTLIPGLVDSHCHLFMSASADPRERESQLKADFVGMRGVIAGHDAEPDA